MSYTHLALYETTNTAAAVPYHFDCFDLRVCREVLGQALRQFRMVDICWKAKLYDTISSQRRPTSGPKQPERTFR